MHNMARLHCFSHFLLPSFAAFLLASGSSLINAISQSHGVAGVFMLIEGGMYTLNFTAATAACRSLNVTIATGAQMEQALQHGLETCKFGWTAEQIAIIPRLTSDKNCGQGKTGVVTWKAATDRMFGVFCFNASDLEQTLKTSTASPQSSRSSTTLTALSRTPGTPLGRSRTKSPPSTKTPVTTKSLEKTSLTSAFALLIKTTRSTRASSSASPSLKPFFTHIPYSLPRLITSKSSIVSFAFSTSTHATNIFVSSESVLPQPVNPAKPSLGVVPTALIILAIVLLLLTAAGAVWYYKFWSQRQKKDDIETEMWKHTDSEMDLHGQHEAQEDDDEEDSDRKYSSDITLCVNPDIKANSSE